MSESLPGATAATGQDVERVFDEVKLALESSGVEAALAAIRLHSLFAEPPRERSQHAIDMALASHAGGYGGSLCAIMSEKAGGLTEWYYATGNAPVVVGLQVKK